MGNNKTTESLLLPKATILQVDGQTLRVPFDKNENATANKIVTAQLRQALQFAIKSYRDGETVMSPKELNDLAMAVKNLTTMSKDVYEAAEPIVSQKSPVAVEIEADEVDFSATPDSAA